MYNVSNDYKTQMMDKSTERRISGTIGDVEFTGEDIILESFEILNRSAEEQEFKIGGVYIGQLLLTFKPSFLSKVNKRQYIGQEIEIFESLKLGEDDWEEVPLGIFTVKTADISKNGIAIEAHDHMERFDKPFDYFTTYGSIYDLLRLACLDCGVELGSTSSDIQAMPNGTETLYLVEQNDIETYRDFLYWIAQTAAGFATCGRDGRLYLRAIGGGDEITIDATHRDVDAVFSDYITKYTQISLYDNQEEKTKYYKLTPNDGLTMNLGANPLLQTIVNADEQEAIAYLEQQIAALSEYIETLNGQIEVINGQIEAVEEELVQHPDDPELIAQLEALQAEKAIKEKRVDDLEKDKEDFEKELEELEEGIIDKSKVFKQRACRRILNAVAQIQYTPFAISSARDASFDLGDKIKLTGGLVTEETGCIMAASYKIRACTFYGYGGNPALTDSRSSTDKSVTAVSKATKDTGNKIQFIQFINAATHTINKNQTEEIGHLYFQVGQTSDVEIWTELKLRTWLSPERKAGIQLDYFLDGEEITAYHPVEEWHDEGFEPDIYLEEDVLVFDTETASDEAKTHTISFHYHLRNLSPNTLHIWRVKATGLEGIEFLDTGCAHILLWAQSMKEQEGWIGLIEAKDSFPIYPIKGMSILGDISEEVTITTEAQT